MSQGSRFWYPPAVRAGHLAAALTAGAAGLIAIAAAALLLWNHVRIVFDDPLESPRLKALKADLAARPADESLKAEIRRLDLHLREEYFARRDLAHRCAYLLAAAAATCLLAARLSAHWRRKLPHPTARQDEGQPDRASAVGKWATVGVAAALAAAASTLAWVSRPPSAAPPSYPSPEEIARNWPRFRGPGGRGVSPHADPPTSWDAKGKRGILWQSAVPLPGRSSPVVWAGRVFLTGATEQKREIYCFDADSGQMTWRHTVGEIPGRGQPPEAWEDTGLAAPTPVTDGKHVCAIFANGDLVCLDASGRQLWARNLGTPDNPYNHASSLVMYRHLLLIQWDQAQAEDNKSRLIALDVRTGREVYRKGRNVGASWTTPIIIATGQGDQLITCSNPWVIAYNPAAGTELWRARCLEGDGAPSPTFAGGLVLATNVSSCLAAIRPDGRGDVTESHILWKAEEDLPDVPSPVSSGELVFLLASQRDLTCYELTTGKRVWTRDLKANFASSPSVAGDKLYVTSTAGDTTVLRAAHRYELIGRGRLQEKCEASFAFAPGRIYIRGEEHLFCIGGDAK